MRQRNIAVVLLWRHTTLTRMRTIADGTSDYKPGIEVMDSLTRASKMLCNVIYHCANLKHTNGLVTLIYRKTWHFCTTSTNETDLFFFLSLLHSKCLSVRMRTWSEWKFTTAWGEMKNWNLSSGSSCAIHQSETIAIVLCIDRLMI